MPVDAQLFRSLMGSFPTGVTIVATVDGDGLPRGLTTQSILAVTTDPPLLVVSVAKTSRTLEALRRTGAFVVSFLAAGREDLATRFASKADDKFAGVSWRASAAAKGSPILERDSVATAECVVTQAIEAGDHWLFIASVEAGTLYDGTPLMYYRRTYSHWPEGRPAPPL